MESDDWARELTASGADVQRIAVACEKLGTKEVRASLACVLIVDLGVGKSPLSQ